MSDTFDILRKLVSEVEYKPGWRFKIVDEDGALRLVITDTLCTDAYNPSESFPISHFHPVPIAEYNEKAWKRWIYEQCRRTENHEIGEWLRWGEERPFAPLHGPGEDPYTVHEYRDDADRRTTQDGSMRSQLAMTTDEHLSDNDDDWRE
jgi:hypothetical protein